MGQWEWVHIAIGAVASIIFLVQTFGVAGESGEGDADFDGGADMGGAETGQSLSDFLSVRNFVAFFIGYGWVTLAGLLSGFSQTISSALGVVAGIVFAVVSLALIRAFLKFQEDGSLRMEELVGKSATVYIAIGEGGHAGKVMVDTNKGRSELPARTRGEALKPGTFVRIEGVEDGVLWVSAGKEP